MDHIHRLGRQVSALRKGGHGEWADEVNEAANNFMRIFGYGDTGWVTLNSIYRMAMMEDPRKSLWMGAWKWPANA